MLPVLKQKALHKEICLFNLKIYDHKIKRNKSSLVTIGEHKILLKSNFCDFNFKIDLNLCET